MEQHVVAGLITVIGRFFLINNFYKHRLIVKCVKCCGISHYLLYVYIGWKVGIILIFILVIKTSPEISGRRLIWETKKCFQELMI